MGANSLLTHEHLKNRYRFTGILTLETGLHIGNGRSSTRTDALIIRNADNVPFIPGSSFKGALRSSVERIAPNIPNIWSCQLIDNDSINCLTVSRQLQNRLQEAYETSETAQRARQTCARVLKDTDKKWLVDNDICTDEELSTATFARILPYRFIERNLCDTCRIFGSTVLAAKIRVSDLPIDGEWAEIAEIRDGVGIDRDTETAKPKVKFDLEVVPAQTNFAFRLDAENLNDCDLALLCIGLQEFRASNVPLGGSSSRGLGQCRLSLDTICHADLNNTKALIDYLTASKEHERMTVYKAQQIDNFISDRIQALFL